MYHSMCGLKTPINASKIQVLERFLPLTYDPDFLSPASYGMTQTHAKNQGQRLELLFILQVPQSLKIPAT